MAKHSSLCRSTILFLAAFATTINLAACDRARTDIAQTLARDPQRLVVVLRQCRDDPTRSDERICRAASEAWRKRFFGHDRSHAAPASPPPQVPAAPLPSDTDATPWMFGP